MSPDARWFGRAPHGHACTSCGPAAGLAEALAVAVGVVEEGLGLFGLDLKPEPKKSLPAPQNRLGGGGGDDDRFPDCARHCTLGTVSRTRWLLVNVVGGGIVAAVVGNPLLWIAWAIGVVAHVSYVVAMGRERVAVEAEQQAARLAAEQRREEKDARRPLQASPVVVSERVVERQVVVTRCRYCKELTPVDLVECKSCGARL